MAATKTVTLTDGVTIRRVRRPEYGRECSGSLCASNALYVAEDGAGRTLAYLCWSHYCDTRVAGRMTWGPSYGG